MSRKTPHNRDEESCPALEDQVKANPSLQHHMKVSPSLHPGIKTGPSPWVWSSLKGSLSKLRADNSISQGCRGLTSPYLQCTSCHRDTRRTVNMATLATQPVAKRCQRFTSRLHTPLVFMSANRSSQQGQVQQHQGHIQQGHGPGHVQTSVFMADVQLLALQRKCEEPPPPFTFPTLATGRSQGVNYVRVAGKTSQLRLQPTRLLTSRAKDDAHHQAGRDYKDRRDEVGADVDFSGRTSSVHSSLGVVRIPQAPQPSQPSFHPHSEVRSVPKATITLTMEETVEGETISITRQLVVPEEHPAGQHVQNSPSAKGLLSEPDKEPPGQRGQINPIVKGLLSVPDDVHVYEGRPGYTGSGADGYYQILSTGQGKINPGVSHREDVKTAGVISLDTSSNSATHDLELGGQLRPTEDKSQSLACNISLPGYVGQKTLLSNKPLLTSSILPNIHKDTNFKTSRSCPADDKELKLRSRTRSVHKIILVSPLTAHHKAKRF